MAVLFKKRNNSHKVSQPIVAQKKIPMATGTTVICRRCLFPGRLKRAIFFTTYTRRCQLV